MHVSSIRIVQFFFVFKLFSCLRDSRLRRDTSTFFFCAKNQYCLHEIGLYINTHSSLDSISLLTSFIRVRGSEKSPTNTRFAGAPVDSTIFFGVVFTLKKKTEPPPVAARCARTHAGCCRAQCQSSRDAICLQ